MGIILVVINYGWRLVPKRTCIQCPWAHTEFLWFSFMYLYSQVWKLSFVPPLTMFILSLNPSRDACCLLELNCGNPLWVSDDTFIVCSQLWHSVDSHLLLLGTLWLLCRARKSYEVTEQLDLADIFVVLRSRSIWV